MKKKTFFDSADTGNRTRDQKFKLLFPDHKIKKQRKNVFQPCDTGAGTIDQKL